MALQAKQTTQQRLMLAPSVTLALEILRMPTLELRTFLEHQLEENPLLELEEIAEDDSFSAEPELTDQEPSSAGSLDEDWLSHWETDPGADGGNADEEFRHRAIDQRLVAPQSLHESLRLQLGCQQLSEAERQLGELIILQLDQYGYLEGALDELSAQAQVGVEQMESILKVIQHFDPPGVGARDLRECLMIQLEYQNASSSLAYRILRDHFPLFVQHRTLTIAKTTGASQEEVAKAFECLKQLDPKPGRAFADDLPPSIVPDLVIHRRETHYDVELNDQEVPHVAISRLYQRMLKDPRTPADARDFLLGKFRQASWLVKAIDERNATLLSIARCLISLQREFLEYGQHALKPLTQAQVAGLIGRHASTVSRAIAGKTIDTPYGVFFLEQFFASGVPQHIPNGGSLSDETIKSEMKRLIDAEDPKRPVSDSALATRLAERNICVARRTIAKYRTSLKILPAHLRKRCF